MSTHGRYRLLPVVAVSWATALSTTTIPDAAPAAAGALWVLSGLFTGHAASAVTTLMLTVLLAVGGLWVARTSMALWAGRRWPRAAALTFQLFAVIIAVAILLPLSRWLALLVAAAALVAGGSLFRQDVVDWTTQDVAPDRR